MIEELEKELARVKHELARAEKRVTNLERALARAATDKVKLFVPKEMWRLMLAGAHPDRGGRAEYFRELKSWELEGRRTRGEYRQRLLQLRAVCAELERRAFGGDTSELREIETHLIETMNDKRRLARVLAFQPE